jgi:hypothetical protein
MKDIEIIKEMKKLFPSEFLNLYFVYKGIKKGYFNSVQKNSMNKIIELCKKINLNYLFIKDINLENSNKFDDLFYFVFISKNKIKEPEFYIKNGIKNHINIGNFLGFPKECIIDFHSNKNKYRHEINVSINLDNKYLEDIVFNFVCDKRMISYMKNKKNKIKKELENNLMFDKIDYEIEALIIEKI